MISDVKRIIYMFFTFRPMKDHAFQRCCDQIMFQSVVEEYRLMIRCFVSLICWICRRQLADVPPAPFQKRPRSEDLDGSQHRGRSVRVSHLGQLPKCPNPANGLQSHEFEEVSVNPSQCIHICCIYNVASRVRNLFLCLFGPLLSCRKL